MVCLKSEIKACNYQVFNGVCIRILFQSNRSAKGLTGHHYGVQRRRLR